LGVAAENRPLGRAEVGMCCGEGGGLFFLQHGCVAVSGDNGDYCHQGQQKQQDWKQCPLQVHGRIPFVFSDAQVALNETGIHLIFNKQIV